MDIRMAFASTYNRWLYIAAVASSTAGIIHAYYMPEHFEMWVGYGIFFLVATVCQVLWALVVLADRPIHRTVLWAGILGNAAIIAMWIVARTIVRENPESIHRTYTQHKPLCKQNLGHFSAMGRGVGLPIRWPALIGLLAHAS